MVRAHKDAACENYARQLTRNAGRTSLYIRFTMRIVRANKNLAKVLALLVTFFFSFVRDSIEPPTFARIVTCSCVLHTMGIKARIQRVSFHEET